jgi:plastocyanin
MTTRTAHRLTRLLSLLLCLFLLAADKSGKGDKAEKAKVTIKNLEYSPSSVTIKAGETVVWANKDDRDHTVTAKDFNSGTISAGDTYEYTFAKAGTYAYSCKYHPRMKGTVVVK